MPAYPSGSIFASGSAAGLEWANYADSALTDLTPLVTVSNTDTMVTNDGLGSTIDTYTGVPLLVANRIQGVSGRIQFITVEFEIDRVGGTGEFDLITHFDIGGGFTNLFERYQRIRGNVARRYSQTFMAYNLDTWALNGAAFYVNTSVAAKIYNVRYLIARG